jgi:antitoxin component of MazEF toxin-antitoxin module
LLIPRRTTALVYGLSALDDRGRLADRTIMQALGWSAGLRLDISETNGRLVIRPREHGAFHVTGQGHLRIPAALRHRCGLEPGDRVLLAADPHQRQLVAYPPAALDALIGGQAADSRDGEPV